MAKTARKKAGESGNTVVDIPHEEVPVTDDKKATSTSVVTVITIDQQIKNEIAKFSIADSAIAQMKEQYGSLVITGADDKAGYKAVKEAWNVTRTVRTDLEKKGLALRKDYQVITKAISAEENRLIDLVSPLEDELHKKWKAIDDEKERVKKEAEEKEQARLMARVEEIQILGMTFVDGFYQIGGTISVDVASLRQFPDDQYEKLKGAISAKKAEMDKAEADRLEQQRLDDEKRQRDADELKRQQDELRKQQEDLQRQKDELAQAQAETARLKLENRINQLLALGMTKGHNTLDFDNGFKEFSTLISDVAQLPDEKWATFLLDHKEGIAERNRQRDEHQAQIKKEQEENDRREKFIAESLTAVGFIYDYGRKLFKWTSKEVDPIEATWNDFAGLDDTAIATKAHQLGDMITAAKAHETRIINEREAEQKKQENLALSDRDRFFKDVARIEAAVAELSAANYKTKKFQTMAANLRENLTQELENTK